MTTIDFLEKYYPKYDNCNLVARLNDLYCIIDNEVMEGSSAEEILNTEFNGSINDNRARIYQYISTLEASLYKIAIQAMQPVKNEYKELINNEALKDMANKYTQLEKEFNEYRKEFKYCVIDMEYCFNAAREGDDLNYLRSNNEPKYFNFKDYINQFKK